MSPRPTRLAGAAAVVVAALLAFASTAPAGGVLIADGGLGGAMKIVSHRVRSSVQHGIAVTEVEQVFLNETDRQIEGLYVFPVPKRASVSQFSMWIRGKEMVGEVVERQRARQIYDSYKAQGVDPGLLEQVSHKSFEMRIFPIAPRAEQRVRVVYYEELDVDGDWATWVYPLATKPRPGLDETAGTFSLDFEVSSPIAIAEVKSPSHRGRFAIATHTPHAIHASLEVADADLGRDVVVAYRLSRATTGMDIVTSQPPGEDGYFCLTVTAGAELERPSTGADWVFVLDTSGSMANDGKLGLSRRAIASFIRSLDARDRFDVIGFDIRAQALFDKLRDATRESLAEAEAFLEQREARGGTRLRHAVSHAYEYADSDRTLNVVVLSDGMTEQTERDQLMTILQARPWNSRVFCIGVGNEVERELLDRVANEAGGFASFLSTEDDFERQAKAFRRKAERPAASDLRLTLPSAQCYDIEPRKLPDLYQGRPLRIYGRFKGEPPTGARLTSTVLGREVAFESRFDASAAAPERPAIERMWAWHRIRALQPAASEQGSRQAVRDIVRLGEGYSIVTEWTSFLVLEADGEYERWKIERRNALRVARERDALERVRTRFAKLRDKADGSIGPAAAERRAAARERHVAASDPGAAQPIAATPRTGTRTRSNRLFGGGGGGGAIDPVLALIAAALAGALWIARARR